VQNSLSSSLAKLSSGLRINNAGDDAAGLTIATDLGAQVSGLTQASRNAQDGTSVVQTADGALSQVQSLLGNLRDLAVQAANDSNSDSARAAITTQASAITAEISRLGTSVNFNGRNLLDGSITNMSFQVGANGDSASQIKVDLSSANLKNVANALTNGSKGTSLTTTQAATVGAVNDASTSTATTVTLTTATKTALAKSGATADDQVSALNSDQGFSAAFTAVKVTTGTGTSAVDTVVITAKDGGTATAGTAAAPATSIGTLASGAGTIDFTSATSAQASIASIQAQLDQVSTARASIGAAENRFTSAESTIATSITNLTAAKSRITDVDMASEMVSYSRSNILSQAGTAMLAQANSLPQLALKLLG
jgi:flagellin